MRNLVKSGALLLSLVLSLLLCSIVSQAAELPLVKKQRFELTSFTTQNGANKIVKN